MIIRTYPVRTPSGSVQVSVLLQACKFRVRTCVDCVQNHEIDHTVRAVTVAGVQPLPTPRNGANYLWKPVRFECKMYIRTNMSTQSAAIASVNPVETSHWGRTGLSTAYASGFTSLAYRVMAELRETVLRESRESSSSVCYHCCNILALTLPLMQLQSSSVTTS